MSILTHIPASGFARRAPAARLLRLALAGLVLTGGTAAAQIAEAPRVVHQLRSLRVYGDLLAAHPSPDLPVNPIASEYHWQGIARHPDPDVPILYATLSYPCDDGGGVLAIIEIASATPVDQRLRSNRLSGGPIEFTQPPAIDRVVRVIRFPDHYHPASVQTAGHYLAMSLGSNSSCSISSSETRLYDISDPLDPVLLNTIPGSTGTLGFTQVWNGQYLLAVAANDIETVEFYLLNEDMTEDQYDYWNHSEVYDGEWPYCGASGPEVYCPQAISLIQQAEDPNTPGFDQYTYLCAMNNHYLDAGGNDLLRIYRLEFSPFDFDVKVFYIDTKTFPSDPSGNFNAGSSIWTGPNGDVILYKMPYYNTGPGDTIPIVEHSSFRAAHSGASDFPCMGHVQLYTAKNREEGPLEHSAGVDVADELYENYRQLNSIDPETFMGDSVSSVAWTLPVGTTARLWQGPDWTGNYLDLVGTDDPEWYDDLSLVNWTSGSGNANNKISSVQFLRGDSARHYHVDGGTMVDVLQQMNLLAPGGPCAVLSVYAGSYPTPAPVQLDVPMRVRAAGGFVILGQ